MSTTEYSLNFQDYLNPTELVGKKVVYEYGFINTTQLVSEIISVTKTTFMIGATKGVKFSLVDGRDIALRNKNRRKQNVGSTRKCRLIPGASAIELMRSEQLRKEAEEIRQFISDQLPKLKLVKLRMIKQIILL